MLKGLRGDLDQASFEQRCQLVELLIDRVGGDRRQGRDPLCEPDRPAKHDLSSLRLLGTVGEPINPEAWVCYQINIDGGRWPVVDTWWSTETGMIMITPLPAVVDTKPGSVTFPFPGMDADIVDNEGRRVGIPGGGYFVLRKPWPAMLCGIYGDPERYKETYWNRFQGLYFAGV